jgi:hypothetical protein
MDDINPSAEEINPCVVCGGSGIIEVPSMLGHGTEVYPCGTCEQLADEIAQAILDETYAWIMSNIR